MDAMLQDLRYAVRGLVQSPGFTALTVLCLAVGIGVNSAIFSIADTVAIRPLPFESPERLVTLYAVQRASNIDRSPTSYQDFRDWTARARSFTDVAAHSYRSISLTEGAESERLFGSAVTWNLFPMLGVDPVLGRRFREDEDAPGAAPVVMLSHGFWERRYSSDPSIIGRSLIVNGAPHTVIGVMPPRFQFPQLAQLWIPLAPLEHASTRQVRTVIPYARLAEGATMDSASRDLGAVADALGRATLDNDGWSARVGSMRDDLMPAQVQTFTFAAVGAVSLVLLIACANVANLLLARATARQREMAVRAALGAGRWRLVRQMLTESLLLGLLSAPLGVVIAYFGLERLTSSTPPSAQLPYYVDWSMNVRVLVYTVGVSVLTSVVFGLAPALQAARAALFDVLKDGGRGAGGSRSRNRTRNLLVVAEVALSLVLLVGASLFIRSVLNIQNADGGIETSRLMTLRIFMAGEAYATPESMTARVEDVVRRVEALPGVTAAFASNFVPLGGGGSSIGVVPEGMPVESGKEPRVFSFAATPHARQTLGPSLLAGRDFTDAEGATRSGVAIVNQVLAKRLWPGMDAVGRRFRLAAGPPDQWITIVGIVADFQPLNVRDKTTVDPLAILPYPYQAMRDTGVTIRVAGSSPASITTAARKAIGESDPLLALYNVRTADENRAARIWGAQMVSWMFSIFGGVALLLASVGIYGVLSYAVAQRTEEIGIRTALGASRRDLFALILGQALRLTGVGVVFGAAGAFMVTRAVRTLLYNVTPTDPVSFGGAALFMAVVTIVAGWAPARRATAVDPIVALRGD